MIRRFKGQISPGKKVLVIDLGIGLSHALRLAQDGAEVYYWVPWQSAFPKYEDYAIGEGFPIKKIKDPFEAIASVDLICFFDYGFGYMANYLRTQGKQVFGGGLHEYLELDVAKAEETFKQLGIETTEVIKLKGRTEVLDFLKRNKGSYYLKTDGFRGAFETTRVETVEEAEAFLDKYGGEIGPLIEEVPLLLLPEVEELEVVVDTFFNGKKFCRPLCNMTEIKTQSIGRWVERFDPYEEVLEKLTPFLAKIDFHGPISFEGFWDGKTMKINDPCCYDKQTEVLTDKGWKFFKNLDKTEKIATLNPETHELEYQKPTNYIDYHYSGEMIQIKGNGKHSTMDLLVTSNHNMYLAKQKKNNYEFVRADKIPHGARIKRNAKWNGKNQDWFYLPKIVRRSQDGNLKQIEKIRMNDWLQFLGLYLAEGNTNHSGDGTYYVQINQKSKCKEVKKILSCLPFKFGKNKNGFRITNKQLHLYLSQFGDNCYNKKVPDFVKYLSSNHIQNFLEGYCLGDGSVRKHGSKRFYTTSEQLANDTQELLLKVGSLGIIRNTKNKGTIMNYKGKNYIRKADLLVISERKIKHEFYIDKGRYNHVSKIAYNDQVYCVTVPNHIIFVRRNGKPAWCGNCRCPYPLSVAWANTFDNYLNFVEGVAQGTTDRVPIEVGKWYGLGNLYTDVTLEGTFVPMRIPEDIKVGFRRTYKVKDQYFAMPPDTLALTIVKEGNSYQEVLRGIKEDMDKLNISGADIKGDLIEDFEEKILKPYKEKGIEL